MNLLGQVNTKLSTNLHITCRKFQRFCSKSRCLFHRPDNITAGSWGLNQRTLLHFLQLMLGNWALGTSSLSCGEPVTELVVEPVLESRSHWLCACIFARWSVFIRWVSDSRSCNVCSQPLALSLAKTGPGFGSLTNNPSRLPGSQLHFRKVVL